MLWRTLRAAYHFYRFHSVHMQTQARMRAWQTKCLQSLIPHLGTSVPLYKELLAVHHIDPATIKSLDDLRRLPVLNKATFRGHPMEKYTTARNVLFGRWVTTSGTSGVLFSPLRKPITYMRWYGDSIHYRFIMKEKPWLFHTHWAKIAYIRVLPLPRPNSITILASDLFSNPKNALAQLSQFEPFLIESHASMLHELARLMRLHHIRLSPKYVVSGSERLLPASRNFIEETFGCAVYNRYGLEEFGTIGIECAKHNGFHVNAESCIVEVVDDTGTPVPDGTRGKVLITDLYNYEMPFVRYDTGDRGRISWEKCACGLESPRVWINGRYSAFLTFATRKIHQFEFSEAMQSFLPHIFQFQVAKTGHAAVSIRIVPSPSYNDATEAALLASVSTLTGPTINVSIERVDSLPRLPRGKSQIIADETRS